MTALTRPAAAQGLDARLRVERDDFSLHLDLAARPGEVVALLGPNGAGKSTALRALAGLLRLGGGEIVLDGAVLDGGRAFVPAERRAVGMVFQDYLLFPHLSLLENVAFGPRSRGVPRGEARRRAGSWLERVGLGDLARARPRQVSGGQAQRAALARALVTDPALLLLDEPLAALDASTRLQVRSDLRHHLGGFAGCTVLVTHDPVDAMVLADRIVVVEDGRAVQEGTPGEVARAPRTDYVARLVGLNLLRGTADGGRVVLEGGPVVTAAAGGVRPGSGPVLVAFAPSAVSLHRTSPEGSPRNVFRGRVAGLEQHADTVRVRVEGEVTVLADVTAGAVADLGLVAGQQVWCAVKATEVSSYPA
jgi:molybdate transport system ATP-binding protein